MQKCLNFLIQFILGYMYPVHIMVHAVSDTEVCWYTYTYHVIISEEVHFLMTIMRTQVINHEENMITKYWYLY